MLINSHLFKKPEPIVFNVAPTPNRNNLTGVVGYEFTALRDINVVALGRFAGSTFTQDHPVKIWSAAGVLLSETIVTPSSEIDSLGWAYSNATPVTLLDGETYRIAVDEFNAGDNWVNQANVTSLIFPGNVTVVRSVFATSVGVYPSSTSLNNAAFARPQIYE